MSLVNYFRHLLLFSKTESHEDVAPLFRTANCGSISKVAVNRNGE